MAVKLVDGADDVGQREGDSSLQSLVVQYGDFLLVLTGIDVMDAVLCAEETTDLVYCGGAMALSNSV